jgi:3-O-methylgallate 3,4-dioxygenase
MASIVLGAATAHTPLLILPPEMWEDFSRRDSGNPELVFPPDGLAMSFADAVATVVPDEIRDRPRDLALFRRQSKTCQAALDELAESLRAARPDVVLIISDDQDEWFYENNMPSLSVYWGESVPIIPRPEPVEGTPREIEMARIVNAGYAARRFDVPVDARLGRHIVEYLVEHDFDVSHMTYVDESYGGRVARRYPTPAGTELDLVRTTSRRPVGLPHGYSFVVQRLLASVPAPIVPIIQNTCYPPNAVTPRRCYSLGTALAGALAAWDDDVRVAVIASGGLSHFVVDEVLDRTLLDALGSADETALTGLPRERLRSATSECLNWVTLGAIMAGASMSMELLAYEPVYRTEAGTGAGLGFARWQRLRG